MISTNEETISDSASMVMANANAASMSGMVSPGKALKYHMIQTQGVFASKLTPAATISLIDGARRRVPRPCLVLPPTDTERTDRERHCTGKALHRLSPFMCSGTVPYSAD